VISVIPTPPAVLDAFERLYRKIVKPGDLVFDIGANIGENTALFAKLGAQVIAVEPLPQCAESIAAQMAAAVGEVRLEQCAVGSRAGTLELAVCSCALDTSSASPRWISAMKRAGLAHGPWDQRVVVPVTTLDALITRYGAPSFVKVDVEGYELEALLGLSRRVGGISLETHRATLDDSLGCVDRLRALGFERFAISPGHSAELSGWMDARAAAGAVATLEWGDLYAR
jgi:FkbM family methyltransferase